MLHLTITSKSYETERVLRHSRVGGNLRAFDRQLNTDPALTATQWMK